MTLAVKHPLGVTGRVLLVDDSVIALEAIGSKLKEHGLDVGMTDSPREALELATEKGRSYDLFDEAAPPIMVVDASESSVRRVTAFDAGADDDITPWTPPAELAARLASTLRSPRCASPPECCTRPHHQGTHWRPSPGERWRR